MVRDLVEKPDGSIVHRGNGKQFDQTSLRGLAPGDKVQRSSGQVHTVKSVTTTPGGFTIMEVVEEAPA